MARKIYNFQYEILTLTVLFLLLAHQSTALHEQYNEKIEHHNNYLRSEIRLMQSSQLGFDLSAFSLGSFGSNSPPTPSMPNPISANTNNVQARPIQAPAAPVASSTQASASSNPLAFSKISNNQFSGITLFHQIPTKFLFNEIYTFRGSVSGSASKINIILSSVLGDNNRISVSQDLNGNRQFEVPVLMSIAGKFYLTVFTGSSGSSTRTQYEITQRFSNQNFGVQSPKAIDQLSIYEKDNKIYVKWNNLNGDLYPIVKLTFQQYSTLSKVQFIFSNFQRQVSIPIKQLWSFEKSTVSIAAVQAKSSTSSAVAMLSQYSIPKMIFFDAQQHHYSQTRTDLVTFDAAPFSFKMGSNFALNGKTNSVLKNQVVVLQPSKTFKSYLINSFLGAQGTIQSGSNINLNIDISQEGGYIIQVNHNLGYAVLNRPVYVGSNSFPILPDSQDLKQNNLSPAQIANLQPRNIIEQRNILLNLINKKRAQFGLGRVDLDDKLNALAQQHTDDMVKRGYSSHFTPQGLGPTDRALNNQIYQEIGQNIGVNSNITDAHYRLCRSNIHLRNIVNQKWVRVGLGIKLNNNNSFVITQQFSIRDLSKAPVSASEINNIKSQIVSFVIFSNRSIRNQNLDLSNLISSWHQSRLNSRSADLSSYLGSLGYSRYSGSVIRVTYNSQSLAAIKGQPYLFPLSSVYTQIGMSVKFNSGFLQVYVGYIA